MCGVCRPAAACVLLAGLLALHAAEAAAQSRRAMAVRLTVARSCTIATGAGAGAAGLAVTCSRGATPSVASRGAPSAVPQMTQRTMVEVAPAPQPVASPSVPGSPPDGLDPLDVLDEPDVLERVADIPVRFELVTINF